MLALLSESTLFDNGLAYEIYPEMKEALFMSTGKKVIRWIATAFFALAFLSYFPSFAALISLLLAVLCMPVQKVRNFLAQYKISGKLKIIITIILFVLLLATAPSTEDKEEPVAPSSSSISEEESDLEPVPDEDPAITDEQNQAQEEAQETIETEPTVTEEPTQAEEKTTSSNTNTETEAGTGESQSAPVQSTTPEKIVCIGSTESDKFHTESCRYAKEIIDAGNAIYFESYEAAEAAGYTPCAVCKPK